MGVTKTLRNGGRPLCVALFVTGVVAEEGAMLSKMNGFSTVVAT